MLSWIRETLPCNTSGLAFAVGLMQLQSLSASWASCLLRGTCIKSLQIPWTADLRTWFTIDVSVLPPVNTMLAIVWASLK